MVGAEPAKTKSIGCLGVGAGAPNTAAEATEALKVYDGLPVKLSTSCAKDRNGDARRRWCSATTTCSRVEAQSAVSPLEIVTTQCNWLEHGIERTRALYELGQAHEALGNTENACEAYQRVIARWSAAKKSVTLDKAKLRA